MNILRKFRHLLGWWTGHGVVLSQQEWEAQYQGGTWDFIQFEKERYTALSALIREHLDSLSSSPRSVLDLGCGEGWLQESLHTECRYVGLDLSNEAITRARTRFASTDHCEWSTGDFTSFVPQESFNVIVFNESLYYAANPLAELKRWMPFVLPGGIMVVSMYDCRRNQAIRKKILKAFPNCSENKVQHQDTTWSLLAWKV